MAISKREAEVAALVAEGLSNPAIAAVLFVSRRTVASHVGHILAKLDLSNRVEIAVWVARQRAPIAPRPGGSLRHAPRPGPERRMSPGGPGAGRQEVRSALARDGGAAGLAAYH